jgi:hypothetical protein
MYQVLTIVVEQPLQHPAAQVVRLIEKPVDRGSLINKGKNVTTVIYILLIAQTNAAVSLPARAISVNLQHIYT